MTHFQLL